MAIRCSSPNIIVPRRIPRSIPRALMLPNGHVQQQMTSANLRKSSRINKVFEDQVTGILCYRDEKGEMICEGYDEGPRFTGQHPQSFYYQSISAPSMLRNRQRNGSDQERNLQIFEEADACYIKSLLYHNQN